MLEDLVASARTANHKETSFLSAAARALRERFDKPIAQFQSYFLVLFGDKDYSKVLDSLSKVDKALRVKQSATVAATPTATQSTTTHRNSQPMVCFFCGSPGHIATFCYKKELNRAATKEDSLRIPLRGAEEGEAACKA